MTHLTSSSFITKAGVPDTFYLRPNVLDSLSGPIAQCPDIIGTAAPIDDPQATFGSEASWETAYHAVVRSGLPQYLYARGRNGTTLPVRPQVSLFAAPAQLIPWPGRWKQGVLTSGGVDTLVLDEVAPDAVGVTTTPFEWTPTILPKGGFYGLYAWATDHDKPAPIPSVSTLSDMAGLLARQPDLGVSQITVLRRTASSWIVRVGLSLPATATDSHPILLVPMLSGMHGAAIGFIGDTFTSEKKVILMPPAAVADGIISGITLDLEPGYEGELTLQIWPGEAPPDEGATLIVNAMYLLQDAEAEAFAEAGLLSSVASHLVSAAGMHDPGSKIGPNAAAMLGSFTALFTSKFVPYRSGNDIDRSP